MVFFRSADRDDLRVSIDVFECGEATVNYPNGLRYINGVVSDFAREPLDQGTARERAIAAARAIGQNRIGVIIDDPSLWTGVGPYAIKG